MRRILSHSSLHHRRLQFLLKAPVTRSRLRRRKLSRGSIDDGVNLRVDFLKFPQRVVKRRKCITQCIGVSVGEIVHYETNRKEQATTDQTKPTKFQTLVPHKLGCQEYLPCFPRTCSFSCKAHQPWGIYFEPDTEFDRDGSG